MVRRGSLEGRPSPTSCIGASGKDDILAKSYSVLVHIAIEVSTDKIAWAGTGLTPDSRWTEVVDKAVMATTRSDIVLLH
jgi:hypothetical protein